MVICSGGACLAGDGIPAGLRRQEERFAFMRLDHGPCAGAGLLVTRYSNHHLHQEGGREV